MENVMMRFREKGLRREDERILLAASNHDPVKYKRYAHRRLLREPMAYILRKVIFFEREFFVDRRVYVPTIETEKLVSELLSVFQSGGSVLDVGTGSGSLAITLKKELPNAHVVGCDISPDALEVAHKNAIKHGVDVNFHESYYVDNLEIEQPDYIIADLPWGDLSSILDSNDIHELSHMPSIALFHPTSKWTAYSELIDSIIQRKWKTTLFIESGLLTREEISKAIPSHIKYEYIKFPNYSVTKVYFV